MYGCTNEYERARKITRRYVAYIRYEHPSLFQELLLKEYIKDDQGDPRTVIGWIAGRGRQVFVAICSFPNYRIDIRRESALFENERSDVRIGR